MIYPRCKMDQRQIYISADGLVIPCCWIGNEPSLSEYQEYHQSHLEKLHITNRPLDDILTDPNYQRVEESWNTNSPFPVCTKHCSQPVEDSSLQNFQGKNRKVKISLRTKVQN